METGVILLYFIKTYLTIRVTGCTFIILRNLETHRPSVSSIEIVKRKIRIKGFPHFTVGYRYYLYLYRIPTT